MNNIKLYSLLDQFLNLSNKLKDPDNSCIKIKFNKFI